MPTAVPIEGDEQVGRAVDHLGLPGESGSAVDHTDDLQYPADVVQVAQFGFHTGQEVQGAQAGGGIALLQGKVLSQPARDPVSAKGAGTHSGHPHEVAAACHGQVVARRSRRRRQLVAQFHQPGFNLRH